jgi:hypothetical protein
MDRRVKWPVNARSRPALALAVGAVLLVCVALAGWVWAGRPQGQTEGASTRTRAQSVPRGSSGILGTIYFVCTGAAGGDSPRCAPEPIKARQVVYHEGDGRLVARFTSSSTGKFRVELPPGRYLVAQPRKAYKGDPPCFFPTTPVLVREHRFVAVDLACDNGVR